MKKRVYFDTFVGPGWPKPGQLESYFLAPVGQRWFFQDGNDGAALWAEGVDNSEQLEFGKSRIDIGLEMWGHPDLGVLLIWSKLGGGFNLMFGSKGDLTRLQEWVRSTHDTPLPVGLFVPYETAWKAVKEFLETDGELPTSIEWIANGELPPYTFPDP